jgi:hypothetical protein
MKFDGQKNSHPQNYEDESFIRFIFAWNIYMVGGRGGIRTHGTLPYT